MIGHIFAHCHIASHVDGGMAQLVRVHNPEEEDGGDDSDFGAGIYSSADEDEGSDIDASSDAEESDDGDESGNGSNGSESDDEGEDEEHEEDKP